MPLKDPHAGICEIALSLPRFWIEPAIASLCFGLWTHCFRAAEGHYALLWRSWLKPPHLMLSLLVYWAGVCIWVAVVPPPPSIPHGCPSDAESSLQLAIEVCAGIIAYDFIFFWIHLSMHAMPRTIGWMTNHTRHHELDATVLNGHAVHVSAGRVVHHSFVDGFLQVVVNIMVQRHTPFGSVKSRLARWIHNVVVTYLLTEAHTNAATPKIARRLFAGVRDHHLHHTHRGPPYQQFFGYLDCALLSYQRWRSVYRSKSSNIALKRYK